MGERSRDFWHITEDALNYACTSMKLQLSAAQRNHLMKAYYEFQPWPDVLEVLTEFQKPKHPDGIPDQFHCRRDHQESASDEVEPFL
jgi:hypothetical protein